MTRNRPGRRNLFARVDEEAVKDHEPVRSGSASPPMQSLLQRRLSRRSTLRGGLGLASVTILAGAGLAGCSDDDNNVDTGNNGGDTTATSPLKFDSVGLSTADKVVVPTGYQVDTLLAWGTPILAGAAAFNPSTNTAVDQAGQTGMHHDGMYLFANEADPGTGVLAVNHENITRSAMFPNGRKEQPSDTLTTTNDDGETVPLMVPTDPAEVRREMAAHGVSVVRIRRDQATGRWAHELDSMVNRRITAMTEIEMSGPAAGSAFLTTPYRGDDGNAAPGTRTRGTLNNCGRGFTPWGTYLSSEENIQGYFTIGTDTTASELNERYGITQEGFGFFWSTVSDNADDEDRGEFARFDVRSGSDWENEVNNFGWVVEIDPMDPTSRPKKRTAMGRFRHEGAEPSPFVEGKPLAFYMGDDARGEYCYKFVTDDVYVANSPMADMLDRGTLYVARFNDDGTGDWLALNRDNPALAERFSSQAELLVNTRIAADIAGATPMDRPEWSAVDPMNGDVYYTLTNNDDRGAPGEEAVNAANPRADNLYGHIIRQVEQDGAANATVFTWDIFVFGAPAVDDASLNRSGLTEANEFGSPDGLWFDRRGVLWIQTDNGGNKVSEVTNDQMLAVVPAALSGDRLIRPDNQASLKRFLVGPKGCEMTGSELSSDNKTLFANVQHPSGRFPDYDPSLPPRSATLAVTRGDGGEIAL